MERIGPYEIVEELRGGGMARVFRAVEPSLGRTVALKVLPDEVESDEELVARFRREARIVANLAHDHIVRIYHASIEEHPYYIAMEFLWGGTLKERLSKGALPLPEAFAIGESVCSALDCAHRQGVIHRDVKPANIMFTEQGRPVVTDFGIARLLEGTPLTHSDSQLGTPFYMSPEQVNRLPIDSRTDVFSLGAVLYEMVTGRAPFGKDDRMAVMYRITTEEPVPPTTFNPGLDRRAEATILRALAKNPRQRFESCREMAGALEEATLPEPVRPEGASAEARTEPAPRPGFSTEPAGAGAAVDWTGPAARPRPGRRRGRRWPLMAAACAAAVLAAGAAARFHLPGGGGRFSPARMVTRGERQVSLHTDAVLSEAGAGVRLTRFYAPSEKGQAEWGEFGPGWHLDVPYRLEPSEETRDLEGVTLPQHLTVVEVAAGRREQYSMDAGGMGPISYAPPGGGQGRRLYVLADGYYSMEDARGHSYHFDRRGRLALAMAGGDRRCAYGYDGDRVASIWGIPISLVPDESTRTTMDDLSLPETITLVDGPGDERLRLGTGADGGMGYFPKGSRRWEGLYPLPGGSFWLVDRWGNICEFDSGGAFVTARIAAKSELDGDPFVPAIRLAYDESGRVSEAVVGDKGVVRYAYDGKGRLAKRTDPEGRTVEYRYGRSGELRVKQPPSLPSEGAAAYRAEGAPGIGASRLSRGSHLRSAPAGREASE